MFVSYQIISNQLNKDHSVYSTFQRHIHIHSIQSSLLIKGRTNSNSKGKTAVEYENDQSRWLVAHRNHHIYKITVINENFNILPEKNQNKTFTEIYYL